jgi:acyl dehydratase
MMKQLEDMVGTELGVSKWIMIDQDLVDRFGRLTLDEQWIHMDVERARKFNPNTGTIAHGFLTLSLVSHIMKEVVTGKLNEIEFKFKSTINYGINRLRFVNPVPVSSRIRGRIALNAVETTPKGVQAVFGVSIEIEGIDRPAMVSEHVILYVV